MMIAAGAIGLMLACAGAAASEPAQPLRETEPPMSSPLSASEMSPPVVAAIERDGVRYEQDVERQRRDDAMRGGWLVARDAASGRKLWEAEVYANPSDPKSPVGSAAIWFSRMAFDDGAGAVVIENTVGGRFEVDLRTHAVRQTAGPSMRAPESKPDNRPSFD
jgi:hypothetical protein